MRKVCTSCGEEKPLSSFQKNKNTKDGLQYACAKCQNEHIKAYYKKNAHAIRKKRKDEKRNEYYKRWHEKNKDSVRIRKKECRESSRDKHVAREKFSNAVKRGLIPRELKCSWCSKNNEVIHGHHEDYKMPLDVIWLCKSCHQLLHKGVCEESNSIREFCINNGERKKEKK